MKLLKCISNNPGNYKTKPAYRAALVFLLSIAVFSIVQFSTQHIVEADGYHHIKYAELMKKDFVIDGFKWQAYSTFKSDINFLYHLMLVPFTLFGLELGAKLSSVIFSSLFTAIFYYFLCFMKARRPFLFTAMLLASSYTFMFRLSQTKAFPIALIFLMAGYMLLERKRYISLAALQYFFVLTYPSFFMLPAIIMLYTLFDIASSRFNFSSIDFKPLSYSFIGTALGIVLNPYFPGNLNVLIYQIFGHFMFPELAQFSGNEWLPFPTVKSFIFAGWSILLVNIFSLFCLIKYRLHRHKHIFLFSALSFLYFLAAIKSRRFVEYAVPFSIIAASLAYTKLKHDGIKFNMAPTTKKYLKYTSYAIIIALFASNVVITSHFVKATTEAKALYGFKDCSEWLKKNTEEDDVVFNYWSDFSALFFYNTHNIYIVGGDPVFISAYDKGLSAKYFQIFDGKAIEPAKTISKEFKSEFIVSSLNKEGFVRYLLNSEHLRMRYADKKCAIFEIVDEAGTPLQNQDITISG